MNADMQGITREQANQLNPLISCLVTYETLDRVTGLLNDLAMVYRICHEDKNGYFPEQFHDLLELTAAALAYESEHVTTMDGVLAKAK
jgi:hypothetical protein